ncbi:MAG: hypothetical protein ACI4WY_12960 [Anaerovoracaceae bacterium]
MVDKEMRKHMQKTRKAQKNQPADGFCEEQVDCHVKRRGSGKKCINLKIQKHIVRLIFGRTGKKELLLRLT